MLISNVHIAGREGVYDIHIHDGWIQAVEPHSARGWDMGEALAFPGLINSHDHLEFNCYSYMANRKYASYREWGNDIQQNNRDQIDRILRIPEHLRTRWGMYKNLLAGVTTVVHHGKKIPANDHPIDIFQSCQNLHSVSFEPRWKWKLNNPFRVKLPVAMHVGEGTDEETKKEIAELLRWNLWKRKIVAVHGVSMDEHTAKGFHALTWCPATNYFLLGATAPVDKLKKQLPVIFGTDSTLTASWNMWEQLRQARTTGLLNDAELFDSVTGTPAGVWGMQQKGSIAAGKKADIVVMKGNDLFSADPERILLVVQDGKPRLVDHSLEQVLKDIPMVSYSIYYVNGIKKYVWGDIAGLIKEIQHYCLDIELPVTV